RKFRYKVMPILTIVMSYVPYTVWIGIVVLTNRLERQTQGQGPGFAAGAPHAFASQLIADYPSSYTFVIAAIAPFPVSPAPEARCPDRRSGMLGLYTAPPLDRWSSLPAKFAWVASILLPVTLAPPVLLLIGYATQGYGPSGLSDWASTIGRVVAAGVG